MVHRPTFRFKQFEVQHDRCAMKVNTDGVLLGAWAGVDGVQRALDVGTGSGIIALMLAQRGVARVEALEIDPEAAAQAAENFAASPWAGELTGQCVPLQQYQPTAPFDLIISNPPYFNNAYKTPLANRNLARHNDTLPLTDLMAFVAQWLTTDGRLAIILPIDLEVPATTTASLHHLYPTRCCYVKGTAGGEIKRIMLQYGRKQQSLTTTTVTIETAPLQYTAEYRELTKDFYLAF